MYVVRDKRSGKFLKASSHSYNKQRWTTGYDLERDLNRKPTPEEAHKALWCLRSANGARLYKSKQAVASSFYSHCYRRIENPEPGGRRYRRVMLEEAMPWLEIVPVKVIVTKEE
jgi:hypothetical protein